MFFASAVVAVNFFPLLLGTGSDAVERRMLGGRFDYHDKMQNFIQSVPWYSDNKQLLEDLDDLFSNTVLARSYHSSVVNVGMMDGSVRSVRDSISLGAWRAAGTRSGGESIGLDN